MSFGVLEPCSYEGCYGYRHSHLVEGLKGQVRISLRVRAFGAMKVAMALKAWRFGAYVGCCGDRDDQILKFSSPWRSQRFGGCYDPSMTSERWR